MRRQQKIWIEEHKKYHSIPKLGTLTPANGVLYFETYISRIGIHPPKRVVDIGSGNGRNTLFFAQKGFYVYAIDYVQSALDHTKHEAKKLKIMNMIHLYPIAIDTRWPFNNNFFDLAIDNYSSIDIETKKGRKTYKEELLRTLKPGGYALVTVIAASDELEQTMVKGEESNSTIWPNGKFQKNYDEAELRKFYKEFEIVELKKVTKPAFKLAKHYTATNFRLILKKK